MIWKRIDKPLLVLAPMAGYTDSAYRTLCRGFGADITMSELVSADSIYHSANKWSKNLRCHPELVFDSTLTLSSTLRKEPSRSTSSGPECKLKAGSDSNESRVERDSGSSTGEIPDKVQNDRKVGNKTLEMLRFHKNERPFVIQLFGKYPKKFAFAAKWVEENLKPDGIDINMGCPARKVVGSDHGAALLKDHKLACEIVNAVKENISIPLSVKTRLGWEDDDEILEFAPKLVDAGVDAIIIHGRTYKD